MAPNLGYDKGGSKIKKEEAYKWHGIYIYIYIPVALRRKNKCSYTKPTHRIHVLLGHFRANIIHRLFKRRVLGQHL